MCEEIPNGSIAIEARLQRSVPMAALTTFRIGGPADYLAEPSSHEELSQYLLWAQKHRIPVTLLGRGSNVLVSDQGIRGLVLILSDAFSRVEILTMSMARELSLIDASLEDFCRERPRAPVPCDFGIEPHFIYAQAGCSLMSVAALAREHALAGLEFACGIPGAVGGAVYMNAGAYGHAIEDVVVRVGCMTYDGQSRVIVGEQLDFDYRQSYFAKSGTVVTDALFCLRSGHMEEIQQLSAELTRKRTQTQPLEWPSAGSMFKRPHGYFAGKLIADAGLQGLRMGDAIVSTKHAGFVVNLGQATAKDVRLLVEHIQRSVYQAFGVHLETEVRFVGDWEWY